MSNFSFTAGGDGPESYQKYVQRVQDEITADEGLSNPKLLLAVGGTGAKSLQYLRKQMIERFGTVALERMEYLSIDTERASAGVQLEDLRGPLEKSIEFDDTERVNLDGTNILSYTQNLHEHPHIKAWWPNNANHELKINLSEGAGQIRPISRLTFFDNLPKIRNAILQKLDRLRKYQKDSGSTVGQAATDVYIIAGLSGGTGSGQFIDIAALVRQLGDNVNINMVLVLPSVFKGISGTDRLFGNGHAALVELNHYLNEAFESQTPGQQKIRIAPGDIFNYCHLLSADNWSDNKLNSRDDMYVAIGEMLYQLIANRRLGNAAKSVRVNRVSWLSGKVGMTYYVRNNAGENKSVEGEVWKTKFSSFGISKFSSKGYSLLSSYRLKFAAEIIEHVAGHGFQNTDTDSAADTYLNLAGVLENSASSQVISQLKSQVRMGAAAQSLDDEIQGKVQELVDSASAYAANRNVREAGGRLWTEFERCTAMAEEVHMMGPWFQQIENNLKTLKKQSPVKLDEASDKTYRTYDIRFLLRILKKSVERLEGTETMPYSILWYSEQARIIESGLAQYRARWEEQIMRGQELADAKQSAELVQKHLEHASRAAAQYWKGKVSAFAHNKAGVFFGQLRDMLNQRISKVEQMLSQMSLFKGEFESDSQQLKANSQSTAMRSGYLISDFEQSLKTVRELLPQQWRKVEVRFGVESFKALQECVFNDNQFKKLVSAAGFRLLSTNADDETENVALEKIIAQLSIYETDELQSEEQMVLKVRELLVKAMPWMPQNSGSAAIDAAHQSSIQADIYVSIPQVEGFTNVYNQLKRTFEAELSGGTMSKFSESSIFFVPSDNKTELVVYTELHALPIFYLRDLYGQSGSRDYYNQLFIFSDQPKSLHVHKDWYMFADVMPLPNFEGYINNLKDLVRAQILGVIKSTNIPSESASDHKRYQLAFVYGSKLMPKQIVLGVEKKALQLLENRGENRIQRLVDEMNGRETEFLSLGSYTDYCALINYWLTFLVPPVDPQSREGDDPLPVMMTYALNELYEHYKGQALRQYNGDEERLLEAIAERLVTVSQWATPICVEQGRCPIPMGQYSRMAHQRAANRFSMKWHDNVASKLYDEIEKFTAHNNQYFSTSYVAGSSSSNDMPLPRLCFNWDYFEKKPAASGAADLAAKAGPSSAGPLMAFDVSSGQFVPKSPQQIVQLLRSNPQNPVWIQGSDGQMVDARQHAQIAPLLQAPASHQLLAYFEYSTQRTIECSIPDIVARIRANPGGQHWIDPTRQQNWVDATTYPSIKLAMMQAQPPGPPMTGGLPPGVVPNTPPSPMPTSPAPSTSPNPTAGQNLRLWNMASNEKFEVPPTVLPVLLKQFSENELYVEQNGQWVTLRQCPAALPYLP